MSTSRASTPSTSTSKSTVCQSKNSWNKNYQSQEYNEYRHRPAWRNSNQVNHPSQFNTYRPPQDNSRNAYFMYNTPPPSYQERYTAPPFVSPHSMPPQHYTNYDSYNSNYEPSTDMSAQYDQYYPNADMSTQYGYIPQHPHPSYGDYPTFNSAYYNSNHPVEFSHSNSQYPQYSQPYWPPISLPPPPPPSSEPPLPLSPPPNNYTNK